MPQNKLDRHKKAEEKWVRDARRNKDFMPPTFHSPMLDSLSQRNQLQSKQPEKRAPVRRKVERPIRHEKISYAAEETLAEPSVMQKNFPHMKNNVFMDVSPEVVPAPSEKTNNSNKALKRPSERLVLPKRTAKLHYAPKRPSVPLQVISEEEQKKLESLEMILPRIASKPDPLLLVVVLILLCIGLVMVYSASSITAARYYGDASYFFQKQLLGAILGIVLMLVMMRIDYRLWRRFSFLGLAIGLPLLALVLVSGTSAYGASRWLVIGSFLSFQPSELIKLVLALYIADWLARKGNRVATFWYGLAPFILLVGLVIGLVLLQKDMGTATVIAVLTTAMFFTAGANILQFLPALGCGLLIFLSQAFSGYRYYRLIGFLNPFKYTTDINLQLYQSLLALGSGGWFGVGLGASRQKTGYLPLPYIDSIFAVIGEEWGYIGCMVIMILFMMLAFRGFRLARRTQDVYGALLATGITTWIIVQAMINIGATTGTIPYTGVPLPFISYGGTSLVITLAGIGVLLNISRYIQKPENPVISRQTITKRLKRKVAE